jgi:hypothetical protein
MVAALCIPVMAMGAGAQPLSPWENATYPDEEGFQQRITPMIVRLAKEPVGVKCLANSTCPDTGLPVKIFAVQGEEIISPYTGRKYIQGETGYFGPKKRGADGQIEAFGGDPLKRDLPPAIARFLMGQEDTALKAFLTIPGSLRQQYHFAAVNWCRFYPLMGKKMSAEWERDFRAAIATYSESRRPSDGARENLPLPKPHDFIGVPGELLGGPVEAGGTENHKTMWRTSGLLYAQWFGDDARISGYPAGDAIRLISPMLTGFLQTILTVGNGEYDSSTYYPHAMVGYLNLYDFSPDPKTKQLAKAMLDYYMAGYGLKMLNGLHAGAIKRGWAGDGDLFQGDGMDSHVWAWVPQTTIPPAPNLVTSVHQMTTIYRPNRVLCNLIQKKVPLPFEAEIARPTYHSKDKNAFQETFYCSENFALGSVAMTQVDNPTQQTVWSLVCKDEGGSLVFGGGQPRFRHPEGHSPYTQVVQKQGTLLLVTAPTQMVAEPNREQKSRQDNTKENLIDLPPPASMEIKDLTEWWANAPKSNASWLFVPRRVEKSNQGKNGVLEAGGCYYIDGGSTGFQESVFLAVTPIGGKPYWIDPPTKNLPKEMAILEKYKILVIPAGAGGYSGYALEAHEWKGRRDIGALSRFSEQYTQKFRRQFQAGEFSVTSLSGVTLKMTYQPTGLRATGEINGTPIDWANWAGGGVYKSPYLTIKDGTMTVQDGKEGYTVRLEGDSPVWRVLQ